MRRNSMDELEELLRTKKDYTLDMLTPAEKYLLTTTLRRQRDPFEVELEKYRDKQAIRAQLERERLERKRRAMEREKEARARRKALKNAGTAASRSKAVTAPVAKETEKKASKEEGAKGVKTKEEEKSIAKNNPPKTEPMKSKLAEPSKMESTTTTPQNPPSPATSKLEVPEGSTMKLEVNVLTLAENNPSEKPRVISQNDFNAMLVDHLRANEEAKQASNTFPTPAPTPVPTPAPTPVPTPAPTPDPPNVAKEKNLVTSQTATPTPTTSSISSSASTSSICSSTSSSVSSSTSSSSSAFRVSKTVRQEAKKLLCKQGRQLLLAQLDTNLLQEQGYVVQDDSKTTPVICRTDGTIEEVLGGMETLEQVSNLLQEKYNVVSQGTSHISVPGGDGGGEGTDVEGSDRGVQKIAEEMKGSTTTEVDSGEDSEGGIFEVSLTSKSSKENRDTFKKTPISGLGKVADTKEPALMTSKTKVDEAALKEEKEAEEEEKGGEGEQEEEDARKRAKKLKKERKRASKLAKKEAIVRDMRHMREVEGEEKMKRTRREMVDMDEEDRKELERLYMCEKKRPVEIKVKFDLTDDPDENERRRKRAVLSAQKVFYKLEKEAFESLKNESRDKREARMNKRLAMGVSRDFARTGKADVTVSVRQVDKPWMKEESWRREKEKEIEDDNTVRPLSMSERVAKQKREEDERIEPLQLTSSVSYITLSHMEEGEKKKKVPDEPLGTFIYRVSIPNLLYRPPLQEIYQFAKKRESEFDVRIEVSEIQAKGLDISEPSKLCRLSYTCKMIVKERRAPCGKKPMSATVPIRPGYPNVPTLQYLFSEGPISFAKLAAEAHRKKDQTPHQFDYEVDATEVIQLISPSSKSLQLPEEKKPEKVSSRKEKEKQRKAKAKALEKVIESKESGANESKKSWRNENKESGMGKTRTSVTDKTKKGVIDITEDSLDPVVAAKGSKSIDDVSASFESDYHSARPEKPSSGTTKPTNELPAKTDTTNVPRTTKNTTPTEALQELPLALNTKPTEVPSSSSALPVAPSKPSQDVSATQAEGPSTVDPKSKIRKTARDKFRSCENCREDIRDRIQLCSGCKKVAYCNSQCQKSHWKIHKKTCTYALKKGEKVTAD